MVSHLKYISLAILVVQTTVLVLILRYSRTVPQSGPRYLASTTIVISEFLKIITCLALLSVECSWSVPCLINLLHKEIWKNSRETIKIVIPACLYTLQNNLLFIALSNLDAATYQVTYQLKILTTAMFSVTMLHKRLENIQWLALVLLMIGVALVQIPTTDDSISSVDRTMSSQFLGLFVVFVASFLSGFSGVYFEKILKSSAQSLWIRNIQLALFSIILALCVVAVQDFNSVKSFGFFQGYYPTTWIIIFLQAFGGIIVSTVVKYADNILKGFATSISIVLSSVCSYYLLDDFIPTNYFLIGTTVVIIATILYGYPSKKQERHSVTEKVQEK